MIKFRIQHFPDALPENRFNYDEIQSFGGQIKTVSESFPSYNHANRAVVATWKAICKQVLKAYAVDVGDAPLPPVPYTRDSYKPKRGPSA